MSQLKVNTIRHTGASSDAIELNSDGSCTVKATNRSSNLIINGAMQVAQRGTSSGSSGYKTVDRWQMSAGGANAALTQSHHALTSSDTGPWAAGFRHSFHILNAGQSGPDAGDNCEIPYYIEAQDMATCGWDYTSASSYITVSFWIKSSVAQNFYGYLYTRDGTQKTYAFETGSLSADTWTKITKTIPGHADISFVNDNGQGIIVDIVPYYGTNYTDSGVSLNAWKTKDSSQLPVNTTTWWTTSNSTLEITGVQLEVGDFASDFCHEPYSETLRKCQRYYQTITGGVGVGEDSTTTIVFSFCCPVEMRSTPSFSTTGVLTFEEMNDADRTQSSGHASVRSNRDNSRGACLNLSNFSGIQKDQPYPMSPNHSGNDNRIALNAEL